MDIACYLFLTHSFYTQEQMKAFKSLQAYKYFESGFVLKIGAKITHNCYVLVGKIKHSEAEAKLLDVWSIVSRDGSISTAHCTCMAGNSEVCNHIAAMLFAAEYAYRKRNSISCTDLTAPWPMPSLSTTVPIVPLSEMDFGKPSSSTSQVVSIKNNAIEMLDKMKSLGKTASLMRVVEPFASEIHDPFY
ncbi:unnamed protein product [Ceutorhynchus assimilis]|uniref:SWIM-type domain-containing protein n=1 Tax=Ceutorhynchus assimilis TaxID=467358 RepID=A0A9N9QQ52_9CUCU|nr:unnamed protein product [Ceutorhynchus assimilis]